MPPDKSPPPNRLAQACMFLLIIVAVPSTYWFMSRNQNLTSIVSFFVSGGFGGIILYWLMHGSQTTEKLSTSSEVEGSRLKFEGLGSGGFLMFALAVIAIVIVLMLASYSGVFAKWAAAIIYVSAVTWMAKIRLFPTVAQQQMRKKELVPLALACYLIVLLLPLGSNRRGLNPANESDANQPVATSTLAADSDIVGFRDDPIIDTNQLKSHVTPFAIVDPNAFTLLNRGFFHRSAVWFRQPLDPNSGFQIKFDYTRDNCGDLNTPEESMLFPKNGGKWEGGDGFAVVIQTDGIDKVIGLTGSGIGYAGLHGVAVEFDTFPNEEQGWSSQFDHIALQVGPSGLPFEHRSEKDVWALKNNERMPLTGTVRITYGAGQISVSLSGQEFPKRQLDLRGLLAPGRPAYIGLTASNGNSWEDVSIDNLNLDRTIGGNQWNGPR